MNFLSYWFWPNPPYTHYSNPKVIALFILCTVFVVASLGVRFWRHRLKTSPLKSISSSWSTALMTFGIIALLLVVSRVESIQFLSMRVLWIVWLAALVAYLVVQIFVFRNRYYVIVEKHRTADIRDKYLPKRQKRR